MELSWLIDPIYIVTIFFFIIGMQRMSHPLTARSGIVWAGAAMLIATLVTFFTPGLSNLALIAIAIVLGGGFGYITAKRVAMTDMPQMIALYNGMGGGAAAGISAVALLGTTTTATGSLAVIGGLIGAVSFSGSLIAFLKLQGWMRPRPITFPGQKVINMAVLALTIVSGMLVILQPAWVPLSVAMYLPLFFVLALGFGLLMTLPIGGADMPVVISMYNAFTGLAVALDGFSFATPNYAMVIAGIIVGAAGSLLTLQMAKAMNRSLSNVFFGAFGATEDDGAQVQGCMKSIEADDVAVLLAYADKVIIAPGYGMAVAQAQQKVKEQERPGKIRNPPGCREDARAHECPAC
jgi:NAD(P) transhydrogenase subunit beta